MPPARVPPSLGQRLNAHPGKGQDGCRHTVKGTRDASARAAEREEVRGQAGESVAASRGTAGRVGIASKPTHIRSEWSR